jgi:hypothetical protein
VWINSLSNYRVILLNSANLVQYQIKNKGRKK